jgi:hypothetical protein
MGQQQSSNSSSDATSEPESAELMYVKCSVCGKWMDVKPGHLNYISHSLCKTCYDSEMRKLSQGS